MTALTVTATEGGGTANGIGLLVKVLTGAKPSAQQPGGTNTLTGTPNGANQVSVTTTQTGSYVYVAGAEGESPTAATGCTIIGSFNDSGHGEFYWAIRTTSATGTPGATTVGGSLASGATFTDVAAAEILAASTIAEDGSSPTYASASAATAVTTASFAPPSGSLLVAIIGSNGAANGLSNTTMSMSDTMGLSWKPLAQAASPATTYAGVFVADIPATGPPPAGQFMAQRPVTVVTNAGWRGAQHSR